MKITALYVSYFISALVLIGLVLVLGSGVVVAKESHDEFVM